MSGIYVYIAAKLRERDRVQALRDVLVAAGHQLTFDWTLEPEIDCRKPHELYTEGIFSGELAARMIEGAQNCDVFVYLDDEEARGGLIELGAALAHHSIAAKEILWISPLGTTPFEDLEQVTKMKSEAEVLPFVTGFHARMDFNEFVDPKELIAKALQVPELEKRVAKLEAQLATLDKAARAIAVLSGVTS